MKCKCSFESYIKMLSKGKVDKNIHWRHQSVKLLSMCSEKVVNVLMQIFFKNQKTPRIFFFYFNVRFYTFQNQVVQLIFIQRNLRYWLPNFSLKNSFFAAILKYVAPCWILRAYFVDTYSSFIWLKPTPLGACHAKS